ncbi:uncharacterized protein LOC120284059 [Dioscorea cayenensis subsp. rotundata]|uniref:Uncharacterized protein LOC120284059 n=1 Tax=Dioscorea cayennensis subsp. rotundata TaxID=55577 RepID=A0AB40D3G8_DIOCR|nr:uncharacterized protein LOC120284059 [Dioscorea cayenensis subsp. rotundata]
MSYNDREEDGGINDMLDDFGNFIDHLESASDNGVFVYHTMPDDAFGKLLKEAQQRLYPECSQFSQLSFIVKLLHLKVYNKWSNKSFDMLLELLKVALLEPNTLPTSYYDAKNLLRDLGLGYTSIHACKYDCILYWNDTADREDCPICGTTRWKINDGKGKKIPHKVLRYFPVIPRLQRLFMSKRTATDMRWHKEKRVDSDTVMQHPADSKAWKHLDTEFPWFAEDCRNVHLGLATNGFNPFGNMSSTYRPTAPSKDIDVYMQPLIDDLKKLLEVGVETYDAVSGNKFTMRATILWTINDFPAYGNLSEWSTKGYMACPVCNYQTCSHRLHSKLCYMGHRRHLPHDHIWRRSKKFDGKPNNEGCPIALSGDDILHQLEELQDTILGKYPGNKKRKRSLSELNWTKKSIFFELPYWKHLLLRHNLDVMHIEKNICENILCTVLGIVGKTKDTFKARLDLEDMKIRKDLHLKKTESGSYVLPKAFYTMSKKEKVLFCEFLKTVKFPDGYASNISRCVNVHDGKISGLKSHDCHVLMQRLLPLGIRVLASERSKEVVTAVAEIGDFFMQLCCKTLNLDELDKMEEDIVLILCKLETIFPPAFFDVMVHLAVHLPYEAKLCGPVQFRWMYPIERFLATLKRYVRNRARPEGSIAEAYIANECLTFCSMYLHGVETKFNKDERNVDSNQEGGLSVFSQRLRLLGAGKYVELDKMEIDMAHWYILKNCEEIDSFAIEHKEELRQDSEMNIEQRHKDTFANWFIRLATEALYSLACGPNICCKKYTGCIVNGVRFHTNARDSRIRSQNSGIMVEGNHKDDIIDFYGVISEIIELDYVRGRQVVLFKCKWFNLGDKQKGVKKDGIFTSINVGGTWYENDPFILACQGQQHRHIFDVEEMEVQRMDIDENENFDNIVYQENAVHGIAVQAIDIDDQFTSLYREDVDPDIVDENDVSNYLFNDRSGHGDNVDAFSDEDDYDDTLLEYCSEDDHNDDDINDDCDE